MDESTRAYAHTKQWLGYSLNRAITPALRRQFQQHFPDPVTLAQLIASEEPSLNTNDTTFNQTATTALSQLASNAVTDQIQHALAWEQSNHHHHILGLDHPNYPKLLQGTKNAPPVLYVNGDLGSLNTPCVAIVGARKASHNALEQAHRIAQELVESGITVVSGLALGIDAAAHRGALQGNGQTIAVAATGPEQVYPRSHQTLSHSISQQGAVITEFALQNPLQPHCFPRRNRIISGLSIGVLVVEAGLPSGTLTTAQHALRQGREVMAVPGSVQNPLSRGCHELIKNGAALIETTQDVIACLKNELERQLLDQNTPAAPVRSEAVIAKTPEMTPDALTLLNCLGFDPANVDTLVRRSGLSAAQVAGALTYLEISGVIVTDHAGRYIRCKQTS